MALVETKLKPEYENGVDNRQVRVLNWDWTSDGAGGATATTTRVYGAILGRVITVPAHGADAPVAAYDLAIYDEDGVDVLEGAGADRSNSLAQTIKPETYVASGLRLAISNGAGIGTKGKVRVLLF